jgi:hypothetical protein
VDDPLQVYRTLIQHEDTLRNQRLGWMLTATGFLFTALAFAWDAADSLPLVYVIAAVGLLVSVSTLVGLHTNQLAVADLREGFAQHSEELRVAGSGPAGTVPPGTVPPGTVPPGTVPPGTVAPVVGMNDDRLAEHGLLRHGSVRWVFRALYPWRFIPTVIALAWVAVMVLAPIAGAGSGG